MIPILTALVTGFFIGYGIRHSIGITREVNAWHQGYLWGIRHTLEELQELEGLSAETRDHLRKLAGQKSKAPWN